MRNSYVFCVSKYEKTNFFRFERVHENAKTPFIFLIFVFLIFQTPPWHRFWSYLSPRNGRWSDNLWGEGEMLTNFVLGAGSAVSILSKQKFGHEIFFTQREKNRSWESGLDTWQEYENNICFNHMYNYTSTVRILWQN